MKINTPRATIPAALALLGVGIAGLLLHEWEAGRALLLAACLFGLSLTFRSLDDALCPSWPVGTHFLWHMLNALVLGLLMRAAIIHSSRRRPPHA